METWVDSHKTKTASSLFQKQPTDNKKAYHSINNGIADGVLFSCRFSSRAKTHSCERDPKKEALQMKIVRLSHQVS